MCGFVRGVPRDWHPYRDQRDVSERTSSCSECLLDFAKPDSLARQSDAVHDHLGAVIGCVGVRCLWLFRSDNFDVVSLCNNGHGSFRNQIFCRISEKEKYFSEPNTGGPDYTILRFLGNCIFVSDVGTFLFYW